MQRYLLTILLFFLAAPASASTPEVAPEAYHEGGVYQGDPRVEARLVLDAAAVQPGGELRAGVLFTIDPHWHIYWRHSGESGLSTEVIFASENATFGDLQWPAPEVFSEAGGMITTFGYADEVMLFAPAHVADSAAGELRVTAAIDYLVCSELCIPGHGELAASIPVETVARPAASDVLEPFEAWSARVPVTPESLGYATEVVYAQTPIRPGDELTAALGLVTCLGPPADGAACPDWGPPDELAYTFVPDVIDSVEVESVGFAAHPSVYAGAVVALSLRADPDDPGADQRLAGVLNLRSPEGATLALAVDEPLPRGRPGGAVETASDPLLTALARTEGVTTAVVGAEGPVVEAEPAGAGISLWLALLYAFLGGVILNVMPCVFPVLSIKVLSLVETVHKERRAILIHGLVYTLGILFTMWVLAALVIAVGQGWGFQFQSPVFVAVMAGVLTVFALWLFGLFEISVSGGRLGAVADQATGYRRSFFEGILAVILATPCVGPFLGAAVGFALAAPPEVTFVVFSAMGLGLAFPYVLLTLVPKLARLLPRPGRWMVIFKQFLAFGLLGTVVFLFSVMGSLTGTWGMLQLLAFLLVVATATWLFGVTAGAAFRGKLAAFVFALGVLISSGWYLLDFTPPAPDGWLAWSEEAVAVELAAGRPVFVDFTADWCVTCKATEQLVIDTERVSDAFATHDVAIFRADWTRADERIREKLAEFGRGGVPMYLVYSPAAPDRPRLLPEVITVDVLVDALEAAASGGSRGAI